LILLTPR